MISRWQIDGFGIFRSHPDADGGVLELPIPGLTVVHGPNEAGKSTLLAFLTGVLFGFPHGNVKERRHPPLRGGRGGGTVFLRGPGGDIRVRRELARPKDVVIRGPDEEELSAQDLDRLLGGVDGPVFKNVYAFGLTELSNLALGQRRQCGG